MVQRAWALVRDGVDEAEDEELLAKDETALALLMLNVEPLYRPTIDAARVCALHRAACYTPPASIPAP